MNHQHIVILSDAGRSCVGCESRVARPLAKVAGVGSVSVDSHKKLARVRGENLDAAALVFAIEQAGFQAQVVTRGSSN